MDQKSKTAKKTPRRIRTKISNSEEEMAMEHNRCGVFAAFRWMYAVLLTRHNWKIIFQKEILS